MTNLLRNRGGSFGIAFVTQSPPGAKVFISESEPIYRVHGLLLHLRLDHTCNDSTLPRDPKNQAQRFGLSVH
jgi:hypothetical protein